MKKAIFKWGGILLVAGLIIGGSIVLYLFNMPHRDVQASHSDYEMTATALVQEYLTDASVANTKYLQEEGESKILAVSGTVASINYDMKHQMVVLLKESSAKAGVSCTFMASSADKANAINIGDQVTIKGVIRSGAGFDPDLELYEDVIMEKCDVVY